MFNCFRLSPVRIADTSEEQMPMDACQFSIDAQLRNNAETKSGRLRVFCSFGTVRCPSKQMENSTETATQQYSLPITGMTAPIVYPH
jgi:hypothetical protein